MVRLKKFDLGDEIKTREGAWKSSFIVEVIYRGYIVAVNRKSSKNPVFLFINTYSREVFYGSSRFQKYGVDNKTSIKEFIDNIIRHEIVLENDTNVPLELILSEEAFEKNERREQVHYE